MANESFQVLALTETAFVFQPLQELNSAQEVIDFLDKLGYKVPLAEVNVNINLSIANFQQLVTGIRDLVQAPEKDKLKKIAPLLPVVKNVVTDVMNIVNTMRNGFSSLNFFNQAPVDQLPKRLVDYLIFDYLFRRQPKVFGTLFLMGVLDEEPLAANAYQRTGTVKVIKWERIPDWFSQPRTVINSLYQWDTNFDSAKFLQRFQMFLQAMQLPGGLYKQNETVRLALKNTTTRLPELRIPVFTTGAYPSTFAQFGLNLSSVEAKQPDRPKPGIAFIPYFVGISVTEFN